MVCRHKPWEARSVEARCFPGALAPAVPSAVIEPIGDQFHALIPERSNTHPVGYHRRRSPNRVGFDTLVRVLVLGAAYDSSGIACR